ncbi:AMP-activated serine/threonine-protein kinase regulatory subunit [Ophidiomyces ophidiicola]|nr:AMP-activated serine/threonine-protein kinase regulatory subunit [Ophidiomyces ophidiicola]
MSRSASTPDKSLDHDERQALWHIRDFLKNHASYDVLPLSFRLIVFDTSLSVKESLNILIQNGIVSAPLWDSSTSTFAGLLTTSDYINVIQYYFQNPAALAKIDQFRLSNLREIERALGVAPPETISIDPEKPLYEACRYMLSSRARRIPLVSHDSQTDRPTVVSVVTQYRILKFMAVNVPQTQNLRKPLREIGLGTYKNIVTASIDTPVINIIHKLVERSISSVPIVNSEGVVYNVFEAVDVITLIKGGVYDDLNLPVGEVLRKRSADFPGIYTCSTEDGLDTILDTLRKSRVHRFIVVDEYFRLKGVLTLSDILHYLIIDGDGLTGSSKRPPPIPDMLDMNVTDRLLSQYPRNKSTGSDQAKNQSKVGTITMINDADYLPNDTRQRSLIPGPRDDAYPDSAVPVTSVFETPKAYELVPAKRFRRSPQASALFPETKQDDSSALRNLSNQSRASEKSNITVHHDPSKRCQSPIALSAVLSESSSNPFSDSHEIRRMSNKSSHSVPYRSNRTEIGSSEDCPGPGVRHDIKKSAAMPTTQNGIRVDSRLSSNSSDMASRRILEGTDIARREFARSRAFLAFNLSAPYFDLEALVPPRNVIQNIDKPTLKPRSSFFLRIRKAKSSLTMGKNFTVKQKLRHMKTLTNLAAQYPAGSLIGKGLEDLSRLGGESILSKLPPSELGSQELVSTLYSHYAGQVLGAERLKRKISRTMRSIDLPLVYINTRRHGKNDDYMHVISTVLKQFLAELPGGILGSMRLYHALEKIYANRFLHANCLYDPGRKDYLSNVPFSLAARVRMIAFAILALTTDMQLELICSIFGLLSVTADESHVMKEFHLEHLHPKSQCGRCEGLADTIELGERFGQLLCGIEGRESTLNKESFQETHTSQVATMLIDLWKDISRQFWKWEVIKS